MGEPFFGTGGQDGIFEYWQLPLPDSREYIDHEVGAAFCIGGAGGIVSYDTAQTVQRKANYVYVPVRQNSQGGRLESRDLIEGTGKAQD